MSVLNILFNPMGRIDARDFWRGVILLVGAMIILQVGGVYGGVLLGGVFGLLTFVMPYAYLCVYGKRLHDSGRTAWFYLLALLAYFVIGGVLSYPLTHFLAPDSLEIQAEMEMLIQRGQWTEAMPHMQALARAQMIPTLLGLFITNALIGFVAARLPSDPNENQYGLPTRS